MLRYRESMDIMRIKNKSGNLARLLLPSCLAFVFAFPPLPPACSYFTHPTLAPPASVSGGVAGRGGQRARYERTLAFEVAQVRSLRGQSRLRAWYGRWERHAQSMRRRKG